MTSAPNPGRVAGLWYLLLVVIGPIRLIYIPTRLFVQPALFGELALMLWLVIKGARPPVPDGAASLSA